MNIFNGNLLTERKNNQFKLWLEAFNKAYKMDIQLIQNNNNPTLDNAWLSGFSDSEGCFTISPRAQRARVTNFPGAYGPPGISLGRGTPARGQIPGELCSPGISVIKRSESYNGF